MSLTKKKIMFLSGTRADFGKLKPLMTAVEHDPEFICTVFATGMHTLGRYGSTVDEIVKAGFKHIHVFMNQIHSEPMELILANTIGGLSRYAHEFKPDMIVVHGDRVEALAGAIVGALQNIFVCHVEGGEVSGTIDELLRHSVSKLSHFHFVANEEAARRLIQMGEKMDTVFTIGSPDIDIMLGTQLPTIESVKSYYQIPFSTYAIAMFHPVTTEIGFAENHANLYVDSLIESELNYVVIYPNNDEGCEYIFSAYKKLHGNSNIKIFPSIRFESFLTLLKNAMFIIGNSSAGIREAPLYAVPTINIGNRQVNRSSANSIINVDFNRDSLMHAIINVKKMNNLIPSTEFGQGDSTRKFLEIIKQDCFWQHSKQKLFQDVLIGTNKC